MPTEGFRLISSPRKLNCCFLSRIASWMLLTWWTSQWKNASAEFQCLWQRELGMHTPHRWLFCAPFHWRTGTMVVAWALDWWALGVCLKGTWPHITIFTTQRQEAGRHHKQELTISEHRSPLQSPSVLELTTHWTLFQALFCINWFAPHHHPSRGAL